MSNAIQPHHIFYPGEEVVVRLRTGKVVKGVVVVSDYVKFKVDQDARTYYKTEIETLIKRTPHEPAVQPVSIPQNLQPVKLMVEVEPPLSPRTKEEQLNDITSQLRAERRRRDIKQIALERKLDLPSQAVGRMENQKGTISLQVLMSIADELGFELYLKKK